MFRGDSMTVGERFDAFLTNLRLTTTQQSAAHQQSPARPQLPKQVLLRQPLTPRSQHARRLLGKDTDIRPPRDVDVLFELPLSVYQRLQSVTGNRQSQLLQEVKSVLPREYPTTALRGTLSKTTASLPKPDEARVNGGRKVDSCGGRKSDSRQHGLAAG